MSLLEDHTAAFVVRIWQEQRELPDAEPEWRGVVENVGQGSRCFFRSLGAMLDFMMPYLEQVGIDPTQGSCGGAGLECSGVNPAKSCAPDAEKSAAAITEKPLSRR